MYEIPGIFDKNVETNMQRIHYCFNDKNDFCTSFAIIIIIMDRLETVTYFIKDFYDVIVWM